MIKTYFDLDGVLRDLEKAVFGFRAPAWDTPIEGMEFFEYIEYKGLQIVDKAQPTKFYKIVHSFFKNHPQHTLVILTHQPGNWKKYTERWIKEHFGDIQHEVKYVDHMMHKVQYLSGAVLIDDYPGFAGNPNVITVSKTYNKYEDAPHFRITKVHEMEQVLDYLYSESSSIATMTKDLCHYIEGAACQRL